MKAECQPLPSGAMSESHGLSTLNPSEGVDLSMDNRPSSKVADDDEVLNLVKVKKPVETAVTESGNVAKEEVDQKHDMKISELLKSEPVQKENERDDDDTLSESETSAGVKLVTTAAEGTDAVKIEAPLKLVQKRDADEDMDYSAIPSPCPEVHSNFFVCCCVESLMCYINMLNVIMVLFLFMSSCCTVILVIRHCVLDLILSSSEVCVTFRVSHHIASAKVVAIISCHLQGYRRYW